jgi:hypothetical protein
LELPLLYLDQGLQLRRNQILVSHQKIQART